MPLSFLYCTLLSLKFSRLAWCYSRITYKKPMVRERRGPLIGSTTLITKFLFNGYMEDLAHYFKVESFWKNKVKSDLFSMRHVVSIDSFCFSYCYYGYHCQQNLNLYPDWLCCGHVTATFGDCLRCCVWREHVMHPCIRYGQSRRQFCKRCYAEYTWCFQWSMRMKVLKLKSVHDKCAVFLAFMRKPCLV